MKNRPLRTAPTADEAEHRAMMERLHRRSSGQKSSQPLNAVQSPKEKSALEWETPAPGATGVRTKCGRYSVAKVTVEGKTRYELWKLSPGAGWFTMLNPKLSSFADAQKLAQQDASA